MYAEEVGHYWKTSQTAPDAWIAKARRQIEQVGGVIMAEAFGRDEDGKAAFMLGFRLNGERFKVVWPVLVSKSGAERAARVQAATMLYRHVLAACMSAKVLGTKTAFFAHLLLPDGRAASQLATPELVDSYPKMLVGGRR